MGHSIYLADDEKSIRELLHSFLASDGYTVRSFESGDALLEAFRQEPAELVILDIMMPGTDGLTVCRELRAVSDIPIILLTAKDSELDYVMGISQGSDDYLTKPFRPTILLMKVKALLRRVEMDRGKTAAAEDELHYGDRSMFPNSTFDIQPLPGHGSAFVGIISGHHGIARSGRLIVFDPAKARKGAAGMVQEIPYRNRPIVEEIKDELVNGVWPQFIKPTPLNDKYFLVAAKLISASCWMLPAVTSPSPLASMRTVFGVSE